jgi:DNA polymerase-3 subunit delta
MAKQSGISFDQVMTDLRRKDFKPLYFLMGDEAYYIDAITDFIQNNVLDEMQREFDLTVVYGKDTDMNTIVNAAKRYPMMSPKQVLIVKEAQNIKDWDNLEFYLKMPQSTTILVFAYKYGTPDKRKKWYQETSKKAVLFESVKLRDYEMAPWISRYVKTKNLTIDDKSLNILVEFLGTDLSKVANEIDKLAIILKDKGQRITPEIIEKNIGISKDFNVFELQAALINQDILKANRIIKYFGENKKANPIQMVLAQMFSFFANLMIFHYLADKSQGNVAVELKINPYFVKDYERAAKIFNQRKTLNIIAWIRETDARSKGIDSNNIDDGELLKELIYRILH